MYGKGFWDEFNKLPLGSEIIGGFHKNHRMVSTHKTHPLPLLGKTPSILPVSYVRGVDQNIYQPNKKMPSSLSPIGLQRPAWGFSPKQITASRR